MKLYDYLKEMGYSKNKIKSLLKYECVTINNKVITKYDYIIEPNDLVKINNYKNQYLDIIYEDKNIIVVNKPSGILTMSDGKDLKTLYNLVREYCQNKIFIIHRLDKDTSGVIMFAKNEKIKKLYQDNWQNLVKERKYIALVKGITKEEFTVKTYLKENQFCYVYSSKSGKLAISKFKKIKSFKDKTLLDVNILTGRKNQIRVHLKEIGHPIIGDVKYGNIKASRLYLHAYKLVIINPLNNKEMVFNSSIPKEFNF